MMSDATDIDAAAVEQALAVLDRFMAALNARSEADLAATLHFPHYRLASGRMTVWERPDNYFEGFLARAGAGWHHSAWTRRTAIAASPSKVHLDVTFTRFRADDTILGAFRSLWIVTCLDGRWGVQARSSFAA